MLKDAPTGSIYKQDQDRLWSQFRDQIKNLKEGKCGRKVAYTDIAKGLSISRQRLYTFLNEPAQGLPIQRYNIIELWKYITKHWEDHTTSPTKEESSKYLDTLLKAAGFLPEDHTEQRPIAQIERIQRRLESHLIRESQIFDSLTDSILETISDSGQYTQLFNPNGEIEPQVLSLKDAENWPRRMLEEKYETPVVKAYQDAILRFVNLGKIHFSGRELFELYQEIDENRVLGSQPQPPRIVDCQFKTISILIEDSFSQELEAETNFKERIVKQYIASEKSLRPIAASSGVMRKAKENNSLYFPPIIESSVKLRFVKEKDKPLELILGHASCSTHIESVLIALSDGMGGILGQKGRLSLARLSVKSLGKSSESLVRILVTLIENKRNSPNSYQGIWVEQNTILGILQATTLAATDWFENRLEFRDIQILRRFFKRADHIQKVLDTNIKEVFNFRVADDASIKEHQNHDDNTIETNYEEDIRKTIEWVNKWAMRLYDIVESSPYAESEAFKELQKYYDDCKLQLDRKNLLAQVIFAHKKLISSQPQEAGRILGKLRDKLLRGEFATTTNERLAPVTALYNSAATIYSIIIGDNDFINKRRWIESNISHPFSDTLHELSTYINEIREGVIDSDVYLAAGSLCCAHALASFYTAKLDKPKGRQEIEQAIDLFIQGAHYAAKLGHRQQASRHLCQASRCCARLGKKEDMETLLEISRKLLDEKYIMYRSSGCYLDLADGERYLFSKPIVEQLETNDLIQALGHFLVAYSISKASRIQADIIYNIYRVLNTFASYEEDFPFTILEDKLIKSYSINNNKFHSKKPNFQLFLKDLGINVEDQKPYSHIAKLSLEKVIKQWNQYHQDGMKQRQEERTSIRSSSTLGTEHPFVTDIRDGVFLRGI